MYKLGIDIQGAKYMTIYSQWEYEKLREIKSMSEAVAALCSSITKKSEHKKAVLEDDLVREIYKERTRLMVQNHLGLFNVIKPWAIEKLAYLSMKENITSSEPARQHLSLMDALDTSYRGMVEANVPALYKLGQEIQASKHATNYSEWVYERLSDVRGLDDNVATFILNLREKVFLPFTLHFSLCLSA